MKKIYTILSIAVVFAMASFALTTPKGQLKFDGKDHKKVVAKASILKAEGDELVTLPDGVTAETDWVLTGSYTANNYSYTNNNAIAVAFDGNDVYIQGLVYLIPSAWIKGTLNGDMVTFASGQYCGQYQVNDTTAYSIYACGTDGQALTDMLFTYDATAKTLTLTNYYLENTSTTEMSFFLYAYGLVLTKNIPVPEVPTNVTAEPTATTAAIAWEQTGDVTVNSWNLRYRKAAAPLNQINEDFETMTTGSNPPEGWTMIDADGDGHCWYGWAPSSVNDNAGNPVVNGACGITSASYQSVALTPDNWLITPKVNLGGTVSFMYRGQDPSYAAEHFAVYVSTGDPTSTESFVQVGEETVAGTTLAQFTADLSEYDGEVGYIAIRHFNCTDMFRLNIDDFVYNNNGEENANAPTEEWTVVENVTSPYTIEGLTPETEYEVQVQAVAEKTSEWSASTNFTTLAEQVLETGYYLVGSFNNWNQTEEGGRIAFDEENRATVELQANDEFKIITPAENGGWTWLGGVDDNNVGYFLITPELMSYSLDLVEGANFRVQEGGVYHINLVWDRGVPDHIVVTRAEPSAISTVGIDSKVDNNWYNLQGQKFTNTPKTPGIYIHRGNKVILR